MDLYIVKARAFNDAYGERVEILKGMEEKQKSYVGLGKKINKNKIEKLEEGMFYGSFQIILTDKNKIYQSRKRLKEAIYNYHLKEFKKHESCIESINKHNLISEIKIKDY